MEIREINILLVEDNPADAKLADMMLREIKNPVFNVIHVEKIATALEILQDKEFDAVLLDLNLPDSFGLEGLERIISLKPTIPVIMLTGVDDDHIGEQALRKNAADYLIKGQINPALLSRSIRYSIERKYSTEQLNKVNRTLKALSNSSQTLLRANDESVYLQDVCRIIVEDCGHAMVWIGYAGDDKAKTVRPVASAGSENGYLEKLLLTWADTNRGRGPTGTAIRTGKPSRCRNMLTDPQFLPWREEALKNGLASSIVFPLKTGAKVFGAITIYSKQIDAFSEDEEKLLADLADNLSFGINSIQLRAAHAHAVESLRQSEEQYRSLVELSPDAIVVNRDNTIVFVNAAALRLFGAASRKELIGKSPYELFYPLKHSIIEERIDSLLNGENLMLAEEQILRLDGEAVSVEVAVSPFRSFEGHALQIILRDITERKKAGEMLRKSREDMRRAQEVAKMGSWRLNMLTKELFWSDETYRIFDIPPGTPMTLDFLNSFRHPEDREYVDKKRSAAFSGKEPYDFEYRVLIKNKVKWLRSKAELKFDKNGNALECFGFIQDITERKQAEEQTLYQAGLLSSVQDAIIATDENLKITYWNKAAEEIYGWSEKEALGKNNAELLKVLNPDSSREEIVKKLTDTGRFEGEIHYTRKDKTPITVHVKSSILIGSQGEIKGLVTSARDITARKLAEEARELSRIEAINEKNLLEAVIESLPIGLAILDNQGGNIRTNKEFEKLWAVPRRTKSNDPNAHANNAWWADTGEPVKPEDWASVRAMQKGETVIGQMIEIEGFDGVRKIIINSAAPILNSEGIITGSAVAVIDITKLKRTEQALRESEQRFMLALKNAPVSVAMQDTELKFLWAYNQRTFDPELVIGKTDYDIFAPEDAAKLTALKRNVIETGAEFRGQHWITSNQQKVFLDIYLEPLRDQTGEVTGVGIATVDLTQMKLTEIALRQSEERLKFHIENSPLAMIEWDDKFNVIYWSIEAERLFGWRAEEVLGKDINSLNMFYEMDIPLVAGTMERLSSGNERTVVSENRNYTKSGKIIDCVWYNSVLIDENNKISSIMSLILDITEQKHAEEALKNSEVRERQRAEELQAVLEAVPAAVWFAQEPECRSISGNRKANELLRLPVNAEFSLPAPDDARPTHFKIVADGRELSPEELPVQMAARGTEVRDLEHCIVFDDGEIIYLLGNATPLLNEFGQTRGSVAAFIDITERKKAEEILKRDKDYFEGLVEERTRELENTRRLTDIGMLSATVAHELRNPLAAISMALANVKRKLKDPSPVAGNLQLIERKIIESSQIINNLLFYSRLKFPHLQPLNVYSILEECIKICVNKNQKKISIKNNSESIKNLKIKADPTQLNELFTNILNNAFDAVPDTKGKVEIESGFENGHASISFKDNGIGIEENDMEQVLQPFFTTKAKGTGLGLTVCKQIVDLHGWKLQIESQRHKGTTVKIIIPIARGNEND